MRACLHPRAKTLGFAELFGTHIFTVLRAVQSRGSQRVLFGTLSTCRRSRGSQDKKGARGQRSFETRCCMSSGKFHFMAPQMHDSAHEGSLTQNLVCTSRTLLVSGPSFCTSQPCSQAGLHHGEAIALGVEQARTGAGGEGPGSAPF